MGRFRRVLVFFLSLSLLAGCAKTPPEDDQALHILATTYPVYLFTTAVVGDVEGVTVELLVNSQTSCLHDYTLTVQDMKAVERADVIVMNGAGLEDFMADALSQSDATVIDCSSEDVYLFPTLVYDGQGGCDLGDETDPHYWMDVLDAGQAAATVSQGLARLDPANAERYQENLAATLDALDTLRDYRYLEPFWTPVIPGGGGPPPPKTGFITFHDGFQYFANSFGLNLVMAVEEEEGATASAAEIKEIVALIEETHIPAIFVEKNGPRKTAEVIARETGCKVYELDMLMSGEGEGIQPYIDAMEENLTTVMEAFA